MKFKAGDRVHVTSWNESNVDFYATLRDTVALGLYLMVDTSNQDYEGFTILKPGHYHFGKNKRDFYTLATDEESPKERTINNLDANAYETKLIIEDEEDTEAPEVQHIKRENKIELDNHYIIEVKKGLYVALVTSNGYLKLTKDIKKADVYEYKNAAMKHAELFDGRILPIKRYVEAE